MSTKYGKLNKAKGSIDVAEQVTHKGKSQTTTIKHVNAVQVHQKSGFKHDCSKHTTI